MFNRYRRLGADAPAGRAATSTPATLAPSRLLSFGGAPAASSASNTAQPPPLWVSGYLVHKGRVNVILSDGRTFTEGDHELTQINRNNVVIDGQKVFLAPTRDKVAQTLPVPSQTVTDGPTPPPTSPDNDHVWDPVTGSFRLKNPPSPFMPDAPPAKSSTLAGS